MADPTEAMIEAGRAALTEMLEASAPEADTLAVVYTAMDSAAWRPIETAPRDGTGVLLWNEAWGFVATGFTDGDDAWLYDCGGAAAHMPDSNRLIGPAADEQPTHWRPLPAPPRA